jgi:hypothetical protein
MNTVYYLDPAQTPEWDQFVLNHPLGWITHLSLWKKFLESSFSHMKGYYLVISSKTDSSIQAGMTFFEVRSRLTGNRLVSSPFATFNDPLVNLSGDFNNLLDKVIELHHQLKGKYIEIKTRWSSTLIADQRLGLSRSYLLPVLRLQSNPENLLRSFHKTSVRQKISKAHRCGVTIETVMDKSELKKFYNLYIKTRKYLRLPPHPYQMFENLWDVFYPAGYFSLLVAKHQRRIIAGIILFKYKNRVSGEYEAWDQDYKNYCPVQLLIWEAIKQACQGNYLLFDFGRTSRQNLGLLEFKKRWGTELSELIHFYYPSHCAVEKGQIENSMKYQLVQTISRKLPPSLLPLFGNFCYRHLG